MSLKDYRVRRGHLPVLLPITSAGIIVRSRRLLCVRAVAFYQWEIFSAMSVEEDYSLELMYDC